jgi:hypothetical protein
MSNPFEHWAEQEKPKWQERLEQRAQLREKKLAAVMEEKRQLEQAYRGVIAKRRERLLAGPHGKELSEVLAFLDKLTTERGAELVRWVQALTWLKHADANLRFEALHLISAAITSLRESQGLPPFSDPIFEDQPNVFLKIRELLS